MTRKRPRLTQKPIPQDPLVWAKEVEGIKAYLDKVEGFKASFGMAWVTKQRQYYTTRLKDLTTHAPKRFTARPKG